MKMNHEATLRMNKLLLAIALPALAASELRAQAPAGPPPPTSSQGNAGLGVHELLPDIGRIGSQVGFFGGLSANPFEVGSGMAVGGFIDLPLCRMPGGKLSYQIFLSFAQGRSDVFRATNPIAYVANLAAGASAADALAGPPRAPFPVVRDVTLDLRHLQISPFSLKWTFMPKSARLRPFLAVGGDFMVVITAVDPVRDESLVFTGTPPFDATLIGGLVAQAPELEALGIPSGQGNLKLGGHAGAGFELRLSRGVSLNVDYRFTQIGSSAHLHTVNGGLGIHW
jgi:hypothetical protein